jgi:MFS family permease
MRIMLETSAGQPRVWRLVLLLFVSLMINYVDRGILSVAAPVLARELVLSPEQLGLLFSAFFWTYSAFQLLSGRLVDRYGVKWLYAAGFTVWSLATAGTALVSNFGNLFTMRLALGVGESVAYPAVSYLIVRNFAADRRGLPNSLIDAGVKSGPALATLVGGLLVERYGWRPLFLVVGFASLFWLLPWIAWMPRDQPSRLADTGRATGTLQILRLRAGWGTCLGMFALGYIWYFLLTWLPSYLVSARGLSMRDMAVLGSFAFLSNGLASVAGGWVSDRWIARGASPTRVRKGFAVTGLVGCGFLLLCAAMVSDAQVSAGFFILACVALGLLTSNVWAITQTLAGPLAAGNWSGIQNAIGNLGGVVAPYVTGVIVSRVHSFVPAFVAAFVVGVIGGCTYLFVLREISPIHWRNTPEGDTARSEPAGHSL